MNLGYASNGFEVGQDLKTKEIPAWQSSEAVRVLKLGLTRKFKFDLLQTNKTTLGAAWGGTVVAKPGTPVGGAITIGTAGILTSATPHGLSVGNPVQLATVVGSTGILASTVYYVIAATSLTATLSATAGGTALTTTAGTGTGLALASAYELVLANASDITDGIYVLEWFDGTVSQRIVVQQGAMMSMPTIKNVKDDATMYSFEIQAVKPTDGTNSVLIFGVDVNAVI